MEFPVTVESQDAFDDLVKSRLERERAKFADYDEIKTKAAEADEAKAQVEADLAAAVTRAEAAESKVTTFETAKQVDGWKAEVAKATGVPAEALRGSTKEDFEVHAATLKPLITGAGPVIPSQGDQPDNPATSDEAAAVRALFGSGGD